MKISAEILRNLPESFSKFFSHNNRKSEAALKRLVQTFSTLREKSRVCLVGWLHVACIFRLPSV